MRCCHRPEGARLPSLYRNDRFEGENPIRLHIRTAPFVSKAIGVPLPKLAAKIMAGKTLKELGFTQEVIPTHYSVKEAVLPFSKFPGVDIILGPEMKSTGEVMGIGPDLGLAVETPTAGVPFLSVPMAVWAVDAWSKDHLKPLN